MDSVQKAKNIKTKKRTKLVTSETVDLSLAWLSGEISAFQVYKAMGLKSHASSYTVILRSIERAYLDGRVKIIYKGKR